MYCTFKKPNPAFSVTTSCILGVQYIKACWNLQGAMVSKTQNIFVALLYAFSQQLTVSQFFFVVLEYECIYLYLYVNGVRRIIYDVFFRWLMAMLAALVLLLKLLSVIVRQLLLHLCLHYNFVTVSFHQPTQFLRYLIFILLFKLPSICCFYFLFILIRKFCSKFVPLFFKFISHLELLFVGIIIVSYSRFFYSYIY